jgi:serine protease
LTRSAADTLDALAHAVVTRTQGEDWEGLALTGDHRTWQVRRRDCRSVPLSTAWARLRKLRGDRDVAAAELDLEQPGISSPVAAQVAAPARATALRVSAAHLDSSESRTWSLDLCRVRQAWTIVPPEGGRALGEGIVIGHPDTGYSRHPEIVRAGVGGIRAAQARDYVRPGGDALDPLEPGFLEIPGHGTATASVLVADRETHPDVPSDVWGVAPAASVVPLRVSESVVHLSFSRVVAAIDYAIESGCHVISMSLGGPVGSKELERVVHRALQQGLIVFAAAGNYWPFVVYPARLPEVIAVAACNADERAWEFSARGHEVDVTGPGESVWTATASRDVARPFGEDRGSGTSHATAALAGICALWLSFHGRDRLIATYGRANLAAVFKEVLFRHGVRRPRGIDWNGGGFGAGLVDAEALLRAPLPDTPPAIGPAGLVASQSVERPDGALGEIARLLLGVRADQVRTRLGELVGASEVELPSVLHDHGEELMMLVALDPAVRRAMTEGDDPPAPTRSVAKKAAPATRSFVSARLRRRLTSAASVGPRRSGR